MSPIRNRFGGTVQPDRASVPASEFRALLGSSLVRLIEAGFAHVVARDLRWGEGPAWLPDRQVWIFSDIPNDRILQWSPASGLSVYRHPARFANGNFVCRNGDLLTCEHGSRSVVRASGAGVITVLCDRYGEGHLNSPNDVVEKADGTIWFTDPSYGILSDVEGHKAASEQEHCRVYCFDPRSAILSSQIESLKMPNGLCFSSDEETLFVADSGAAMGPDVAFQPAGPRDVFAFSLSDGAVRGDPRWAARVTTGVPDGIRCDADDYLWMATGSGIDCIAPDGRPIGSIDTPETASNLAFGGPLGSQLLVTLATSVYVIDVGKRP
jgi:gluconolactonase